jgi:N-methylhydantoinase B
MPELADLRDVHVDATTMAVLRRSIITLCNEMGSTLATVAFSPVITEGRDFAGALFDADGRLVACGDHDLSALLGTLEPTLGLILEAFSPESIAEGDIFMCNVPHEAGSHLNDVKLAKAVFADGEIVGYVANNSHWTDIGGSRPGSINPQARDAYAEGVKIPPLRIAERGVMRDDVLRLIMSNVRQPHETSADVYATLKALNGGEQRLKELCARYGVGTLKAVCARMQDHSEGLYRQKVSAIADGVVEFEDFIDADPLDPDRGPIRVHLELTKKGDSLTFDFRASDRQPKAPIGCTRPLTLSAVFVSTLTLLRDVPFNHGFIRNVEVLTTPGSAVHVEHPAPVAGCAAGSFEKVIACVIRSLGQLDPARDAGAAYCLINAMLGGYDPRFEKSYVMYCWNEGGWGGGPDRDGGDAPTMAIYGTGSKNQPIEVQERFFPVRFERMEIDVDTAGAGKWRGAPGLRHTYRITHGEASLGILGDRNRFPPPGARGGEPGSRQTVVINPDTPESSDIGMLVADQPLGVDDVVEIWSGGGGGFGDPLERDPALVVRDVKHGLVSTEVAGATYGVVVRCTDALRAEWEVDEAATRARRDELAAARHSARPVDAAP